jgi:hypothetical protein
MAHPNQMTGPDIAGMMALRRLVSPALSVLGRMMAVGMRMN